MKSRINDDEIKKVMSSLESEIPEELDMMVKEMIRHETVSHSSVKRFFTELNPFLKWSPAFVSIILLMVFGFFQISKDNPESSPMKEIRIEYEIKDKNIKILWVKKEGFSLKRRKK